ncbi:MAG: hypothetical protein ACLS7Z_09935 [Christensenellales bacterium]
MSGEVICIEATDSTSGVAAVYVNGHKLKYSGTTLDANIREYADGRHRLPFTPSIWRATCRRRCM